LEPQEERATLSLCFLPEVEDIRRTGGGRIKPGETQIFETQKNLSNIRLLPSPLLL
jgi:hypothetical protein